MICPEQWMHFQKIPLRVRQEMEGMDYGPAEQRCPQNMAIGKLIKEAVDTFHI